MKNGEHSFQPGMKEPKKRKKNTKYNEFVRLLWVWFDYGVELFCVCVVNKRRLHHIDVATWFGRKPHYRIYIPPRPRLAFFFSVNDFCSQVHITKINKLFKDGSADAAAAFLFSSFFISIYNETSWTSISSAITQIWSLKRDIQPT